MGQHELREERVRVPREETKSPRGNPRTGSAAAADLGEPLLHHRVASIRLGEAAAHLGQRFEGPCEVAKSRDLGFVLAARIEPQGRLQRRNGQFVDAKGPGQRVSLDRSNARG